MAVPARTKKVKNRRPALARISDEMKQWSAMIGSELLSWPHVRTRPMFGMRGFYRKTMIFAALPVGRGIGAPNSIIFKMKSLPQDLLRRMEDEPRVGTGRTIRAKGWHSFEINSAEDLRDAIWWLSQAYERAK
jgi:hypothetical protein